MRTDKSYFVNNGADGLHRLCEGFLYFQNVIMFLDIRVIVLLITPITKYGLPFRRFSRNSTNVQQQHVPDF